MNRFPVPFLPLCYLGVTVLFAQFAARAAETAPADVPSELFLPAPVAWVEGPRALAVNPAGLGLRTAFAAEMSFASTRPAGGLMGLGGYTGAWGLAGGGRLIFDESGTGAHAAIGFGHAPVEGLAFGTALRLHAPASGAQSYGAWDLGLTLRPSSWLSIGGAVRDLAALAGHEGRYSPSVVAGIGLRPFGRRFSLAFDWRYEFSRPETASPYHYEVAAQLEPLDGLQFFATVDERMSVSAGVALVFRSGWIGGRAGIDTRGDPGFAGWTASVGTSADHPPTRLNLSRSVARFDLRTFQENPTVNPLFPRRGGTSFADLLVGLRRVESDPSVSAVLLRLDGYGGGMARTEELRAEILRLRGAGKPVYAYLAAGGGNVDYYLASACDAVWMHPGAVLTLTGLSTRMTFFRGSLDKLGVEAQFSRIGIYKSSPEQYTESEPTAPNLEVRNALLDDRYERWLAAIAEGRGMDAGAMGALVDDGPFPARLALEHGLVDALIYGDEVEDRAREAADRKKAVIRQPLKERAAPVHWRAPWSVAVIHVDGLINTGSSGRLPFGLLEIAGSDTTVAAIRKARESRDIAAIVLRVDSPGGSAFASEEIWREIQRTRGEKPVVVSMASLAASGGYYVSCAADRIVADPSTITGSIGVYSGKVSLAGLYDKIGVTSYQLKRGDHAGLYDLAEPWSPSEYRAVERIVDHLYADFIEHVADGRGMESVDDVDAVARGRVWTGAQALDVGLVDELGGLMRAVELARELAEIPPHATVDLVHMPRVGWLSSLEIGKGFVAQPEIPMPDALRATLSGLVLMEMQRSRTPAMMWMPVSETLD